MKMYRVPVTWEMYGLYYIEAENAEKAMELSLDENRALPDDCYYVDGSMQTDVPELVEEVDG
jgi:hypothetical protein